MGNWWARVVLQSLVDMMRSGPTGIIMCARTPNKVGMIEVLEEMHCDKGGMSQRLLSWDEVELCEAVQTCLIGAL